MKQEVVSSHEERAKQTVRGTMSLQAGQPGPERGPAGAGALGSDQTGGGQPRAISKAGSGGGKAGAGQAARLPAGGAEGLGQSRAPGPGPGLGAEGEAPRGLRPLARSPSQGGTSGCLAPAQRLCRRASRVGAVCLLAHRRPSSWSACRGAAPSAGHTLRSVGCDTVWKQFPAFVFWGRRKGSVTLRHVPGVAGKPRRPGGRETRGERGASGHPAQARDAGRTPTWRGGRAERRGAQSKAGPTSPGVRSVQPDPRGPHRALSSRKPPRVSPAAISPATRGPRVSAALSRHWHPRQDRQDAVLPFPPVWIGRGAETLWAPPDPRRLPPLPGPGPLNPGLGPQGLRPRVKELLTSDQRPEGQRRVSSGKAHSGPPSGEELCVSAQEHMAGGLPGPRWGHP